MIEIFIYYFNFGGAKYFSFFFVLLIMYSTGLFMYHSLNLIVFSKTLPPSIKVFIKRVIFTLGIISIFFIFLGFGLEKVIIHAQVSKIVFFSDFFLRIDKTVFGTYVPFWFQDSHNTLKPLWDLLTIPIIYVYESLGFLMGILFFALFILKPRYFYKASLSFIIMFFLGLILWFLFPAISPFDAYINNVMDTPAPQYLQTTLLEYRPNKHLESFFNGVEKLNNIAKNYNKETQIQFFGITTMPSMHIAWALLILYFGWKLWRPSAFFLLPYFLLNAIATVYLLQHYTIDIPAGLIVGIIAIWIANMIANKKTLKVFIT